MPDDAPMPELDTEKVRQAALLIAVCTGVALLVLLIDWKIKQSILDAAKDVRINLDRAEKYYWKEDRGAAVKLSDYAGGFDPVDMPRPASSDVVGGNAGMETAANNEEDSSNSWAGAKKEDSPNQPHPRSRSPIVAVPKGD